MTTTLITGANKGLGFETARRLIAAGHTVYAGSRDAERGRQAAERLGARMVLIDVTDDASVAAAAKTIEADGGLDVLVNNAGIEMRIEGNVVPGAAEITADLMRAVFETNVFGVVRVTHAFLPLLQRSAAPVVVNVSSGLASMTRLTTPGTPAYAYPGVAYPASKAAVNMITVQYAKAFPEMRINAVEPGFTATDLNQHQGTQTIEQGAEITADVMRAVFETNVFGVVRVTHAFLPLLLRSPAPVVVNISSGLASLTRASSGAHNYPGVAYPASKAAVNMITVQYAKAFPQMRINAVEPGFTATNLNRHQGTQTVEEGAEIIVRMAQTGPDGPTGTYVSAEGPIPW